MKELKNQLSGMSQKEKIAYLWSCYKGAIGGTLLAAILVFLISLSIRSASSRTLIAGIRINTALRAEGEAYLTEGFMRQLSSGAKTGKAYLQEMNLADPAAAGDDNYYTMMGILSLCSSKDLDYLIMDQTALEAMIAQGVFLDLGSFLDERELADYKKGTETNGKSTLGRHRRGRHCRSENDSRHDAV